MTQEEKQQLTNTIEHKADMVKLKISKGELEETDELTELLDLVNDAKSNGTSVTEAKYLLEDLELALA